MLPAVLKIGRWGVSKIGVGGVKLAMTEKGAGGGQCQAALCGERLSGAMACGSENGGTGDEFLSLCHPPDGVNKIQRD